MHRCEATPATERAPVGAQVVARANQSRVDYGPINAACRADGAADPFAAGLARLRDPSPDGVLAREALVAAIEHKNTEFNARALSSTSATNPAP